MAISYANANGLEVPTEEIIVDSADTNNQNVSNNSIEKAENLTSEPLIAGHTFTEEEVKLQSQYRKMQWLKQQPPSVLDIQNWLQSSIENNV